MKKYIIASLVIPLLVLVMPLHAEIYRYTDENGQKRWTDDLSQVPKDQRSSAQRMEGVSETAPNAENTPSETTPDTQDNASDSDESIDGKAVSRESLEKEKAELDRLYQQLLEERKELEKMKSAKLDADGRADLNQRISSFNTKTSQYETQLNTFNEKINAYNQKIMKKSTTPTN